MPSLTRARPLSIRPGMLLLLVGASLLVTGPAFGAGAAIDPVVPILYDLAVVLAVAKLFGWLAFRVGQPPVLGELLGGILIGNVALLGFHGFDGLRTNETLEILASLGVIVLLFEVGLESTIRQMLHVGASAALVAILGVATPFVLGWGVGALLLPEKSAYVHAFLGAVLTATSVGITARVLRDLERIQSREAKIILGAAVIDDVLGLVILAVVSGIITAANAGQSGMSVGSAAWIAAKALGFLVVATVLGVLLAPRLFRFAARVRIRGILLTSSLIFCFLLSYLSAKADLAPIVGAFAAGLILEGSHFERFDESRESSLESLLTPISTFLVPIFFVLTGLRVDLYALADTRILGLAALLTVAAWLGKQACSLGVLERDVNKVAIGLGMVPRGEVGLIFANIGATLVLGGERIINAATYAAVVLMVMVTTLVTPPALQWSLQRKPRGKKPG